MSRRAEPSGSPAFFYCVTGAAALGDNHFPFKKWPFFRPSQGTFDQKQGKIEGLCLLNAKYAVFTNRS
jgi:hypothetical protein